jgi:hypothetical protein
LKNRLYKSPSVEFLCCANQVRGFLIRCFIFLLNRSTAYFRSRHGSLSVTRAKKKLQHFNQGVSFVRPSAVLFNPRSDAEGPSSSDTKQLLAPPKQLCRLSSRRSIQGLARQDRTTLLTTSSFLPVPPTPSSTAPSAICIHRAIQQTVTKDEYI